jgi:hypothetical protein
MTRDPRPTMAHDGYARADGYSRTLADARRHVEKGGVNALQSRVVNRPPDPAPIRPAAQVPTPTSGAPNRRG